MTTREKHLELLADEAVLNRRELARVHKINAQLLEALLRLTNAAEYLATREYIGAVRRQKAENMVMDWIESARTAIAAAGAQP